MAMIDKEIQLLMLKGEKGDPGISGDYNELANKPKINGVELLGNKTASDLGLASEADLNAAVADIATNAANIATNTTNIGALNDLTTTVKSSLVAAINEVNADTFSKNVELGDWVPTPGGRSLPTFVVAFTRGKYYRVGNLVYIFGAINFDSITGSTSDSEAAIKGLPYPIGISFQNARGTGTCNRVFTVQSSTCLSVTNLPITAHMDNNTSLADPTLVRLYGGNGSGSAKWVDTVAGGVVWISGVYYANI